METRILIVEEQDQGVRLDKYLSTAMDDCSRSRAQQLIDEEAVRIDDLPVKNSYKVKAGDESRSRCRRRKRWKRSRRKWR